MDANVANVIAAVITAVASIAAAVLGLRAGKPPKQVNEKAEPRQKHRPGDVPPLATSKEADRDGRTPAENLRLKPARLGEVLIVDDQVQDVQPLVEWLKNRGYSVVLATSESAARKILDEVDEGKRAFALGLIDSMIPVRDMAELGDEYDATAFLEASADSGIRLCYYARQSLFIPESKLPLVVYTGREDDEIQRRMRQIGIPVISKSGGILPFLEKTLLKSNPDQLYSQKGRSMNPRRKDCRILLLDDVDEARKTIHDFLTEAGFGVKSVELSSELLHALSRDTYNTVVLDIQLGDESTIGETLELFEQLFPQTTFPHAAVTADLGVTADDSVSGRYLLPMIKSIAPKTEVIVLTGAWEGSDDEHFLRTWGRYSTVQKMAPDESFGDKKKVAGLDKELVQLLDEICDRHDKP